MGEHLSLTIDPSDKDQTLNYAARSERLRELVASRKATGLSAHDPRYVADLLREVEGMAIETLDESMFIHEAEIDLNEIDSYITSVGQDVIFQNDEIFVTVHAKNGKSVDVMTLDKKFVNPRPCTSSFHLNQNEPILYQGKPCFKLLYKITEDDEIGEFVTSVGEHAGGNKIIDESGSHSFDAVLDENGELRYFVKTRLLSDGESMIQRIVDLKGENLTKEAFFEKASVVKDELAYVAKDRGRRVCWGSHKIEYVDEDDNYSLPFVVGDNVYAIYSHYDGSSDNHQFALMDMVTSKCLTVGEVKDRINGGQVSRIENVIVNGENIYCLAYISDKNTDDGAYSVLKFSNGIMQEIVKQNAIAKMFLSGGRITTIGEQPSMAMEGWDYVIGMEGKFPVKINQDELLGSHSGCFSTEKPVEILGHTGTLFYMSLEMIRREDGGMNYLYIDNEKVEVPNCIVNNFNVVNGHFFWDDDSDKENRVLWIDGKKTDFPCYPADWKVVYSREKYFHISHKDKKISIREIKNLI